jgi:DNA-binding response OmpR family regulator
VRALLRRAGASQRDVSDAEPLESGALRLDLDRREARVDGRTLELTYVEFELLRTLVAQPGKVFSRRALLQAIWGDSSYREPRTIDVHVRHLREKVEEDPSEPELILTVRGAGYRLREA